MKPFLPSLHCLGAPLLLLSVTGCSGAPVRAGDDGSGSVAGAASSGAASSGAASSGAGGGGVSASGPTASSAAQRARPPELPDMSDRDRDRSRIDDELERSAASAAPLSIEVILTHPATASELAAFARQGGRVRHVFVAVSYGWSGTLPRARLVAVRDELGPALHFIAASRAVVPLLDEATRTGRVRPIWAANFAGNVLGFQGNPNTTIGVIDTGFDDTHPDLAGRSAGFKDYSSDAATTARDVQGHGTHVASIAVGSGVSFGVGPGTLRYTNSGDLSGFSPGSFLPGAIHAPSYFDGSTALSVSALAVWSGGQGATLRAMQSSDSGGMWSSFGVVSGAAPRMLSNAGAASAMGRYSDALGQTMPASINDFAVANSVANYPAVGDGFNVMSGVAPNCKWFGAKVFTDDGVGMSTDTGAALDDLVAERVEKNVQIVNLSLTATGGSDSVLRAKVNSAVDNGVLLVVAAGNAGPGSVVSDPARAAKALTVGASNDINELTSYSSPGPASLSGGDSEDYKPDVLAPGGSSFRSLILAADSNTADAQTSTFADLQPNDYRGLQGTSMAAPFVAGAAALLIDAAERSGFTWDFNSSESPRFAKMLLLAAATETFKSREAGTGSNPSLGRAAQPKDLFEGYGLLNPDAAIEAVTLSLSPSANGTVRSEAPARLEWEPRAWGRRVDLRREDLLTLTLSVPATADFDLYLYAGHPDKNGDPQIRASSTTPVDGGSETISFTAQSDETAYVFVKRVSGFGTFTLSADHVAYCGNGVLDPGELCDPTVPGQASCCSGSCLPASPDTLCDDGDACTTADHCAQGKCVGDARICPAPSDECQLSGSCQPDSGQCSPIAIASDGSACSLGACRAGLCLASAAVGAAGAAGDGGAAGADTSSDAGAAGEPAGGSAGQPNSVTAGNAGTGKSGRQPRATLENDSGCGCLAAGSGPPGSALWIAASLALFAARRRRQSGACQRGDQH